MAHFFGFCGPEATYGEYMSYIDAFFNKEKDIIQVVERDNKGVRRIIDYPAKYKFYIADPKGKHTSIYGDRLTRIRCKNTKEFRQELKANPNCRLFESDLDPVFSCLAENYLDTDAPEINVGFWDIETDMQPFVYSSDHVVTIRKNSIDNTLTVFELNELKDSQEYEVFDEVAKQWASIAGCRYLMGGPGYAPTDDPFMPITAISIYLKWIGTMFTLSIPPATLSFEEASDLVKDIPNTILFQTEIAMLDAFLDIIKDCDVLSGWNCIPLSQSIWTRGSIIKLEQLVNKCALYDSYVEHMFPITKKIKYDMHLANGFIISSSNEHRFPVWYYPFGKYFDYANDLIAGDFTVEELARLKEDNNVYLKQPMRDNTNIELTYRELFINNLDMFIDFGAEFYIKDTEIKRKVTSVTNNQCWNIINRAQWSVKNISDLLTRNEVIKFFNRNTTIDMYHTELNKSKQTFILDDVIESDILWLIGMWFTDGTSSYKTEVTITNKEADIANQVNFVLSKNRCVTYKANPLKRDKLGIYNVHGGLGKLWWMKIFIYDAAAAKSKKIVNVELLSQLSNHQFLSFFGGCVDGDGGVGIPTVSHRINLCNFNNCIDDIAELLHWNGVFTTIGSSHTRLYCYIDGFSKYLHHPVKKKSSVEHELNYRSYMRPSKNKTKRWCTDETGNYYVLLKEVIDTNEMVEMRDISTNTQYFVTGGVETHNCASYDVPYTVNRVAKLMGKQATKRFCLLDQPPKPKEFERFGSTTHTYQFIGRVNMDMLDLYRKYTYEEKPTYRLDYIGELEVGENKVPYDGTLDQLYRNDFLKFIEYSRQDVFLLDKLDEKLKFLSLGLTYAHENTVLLPTILGTVAATEQALINEAHGRNLVVPNKKPKAIKGELKDKAAGAYVAYPKKGIWDWVGSLDINSLYPSTICALNMSPETIVAQVRLHITNAHIEEQMTVHKKSFAKSWEGMFGCFEYDYIMEQRTDIMLYVDWEDGKSEEATPADIYSMVFDPKNKLAISANGTIFTYAKDGLVSAALTKWYIDRKKIQKTLKDVQVLEYGLELSDELYNQVKTYL